MKHFIDFCTLRAAKRLFHILLLLSSIGQLATLQSTAVAQQEKNSSRHEITVIGEGAAVQPAETISLNLSISSQDVTAATVFAKHDVAINRLKQSLLDAGISSDDITEGTLGMNPTYDYSQAGQSPRLVGYHLVTPLIVRLQEIKTLPHILDLATQSGASNVSIGGFGMKRKDYLREAATKNALSNARERAEDLAKMIGASLGEIISVSDMEADASGNTEMQRQAMGGHSLETRVELKVVYALK